MYDIKRFVLAVLTIKVVLICLTAYTLLGTMTVLEIEQELQQLLSAAVIK